MPPFRGGPGSPFSNCPCPITFTPDDWTITLDAQGPGIHSIFMLVDVSPLTVPELQDLDGKLVWDETQVVLCKDPTPDGNFITIREVGAGFLKLGDGFESDFQGDGCAINAELANAANWTRVATERKQIGIAALISQVS